jgi:hypothetical protein
MIESLPLSRIWSTRVKRAEVETCKLSFVSIPKYSVDKNRPSLIFNIIDDLEEFDISGIKVHSFPSRS